MKTSLLIVRQRIQGEQGKNWYEIFEAIIELEIIV